MTLVSSYSWNLLSIVYSKYVLFIVRTKNCNLCYALFIVITTYYKGLEVIENTVLKTKVTLDSPHPHFQSGDHYLAILGRFGVKN